MSWRDHIKVHPAADLFPMMSDDELKALTADIKAHKLKMPVTLWAGKDGVWTLIDGRNRIEACSRLIDLNKEKLIDDNGDVNWDHKLIEVTTYDFDDVPDFDPYAYVISANIHRRHLTTEQRLELTAKIVAAQPEKSDRQIARQVKVSPTTVGKVRADLEAKGVVSTVDTRTDARGRQQPAHKPPAPAQDTAEERKAHYAEAVAEPACVVPEQRPDLTGDQQDQLLNLALKLLVTVDEAHRKKFSKHLEENSYQGVYVPTCGHRGWKSGRYILNPDIIKRVVKWLEVEWEETA